MSALMARGSPRRAQGWSESPAASAPGWIAACSLHALEGRPDLADGRVANANHPLPSAVRSRGGRAKPPNSGSNPARPMTGRREKERSVICPHCGEPHALRPDFAYFMDDDVAQAHDNPNADEPIIAEPLK